MSIIVPSLTVYRSLGGMQIGQRDFSLSGGSDATGEMQTRLYGPPRWQASIASPAFLRLNELGEWEAMVMRLRGRTNHLNLYDFLRPAPRGTMRGTMTLTASRAAGDTLLSIGAGSGQAGRTLLAGDWLQVGTGLGTSQVFKVAADATANGSGVVAVEVEPPCRIAFASGQPVTWDKPAVFYKLSSELPLWTLRVNGPLGTGFALDLLEQWS